MSRRAMRRGSRGNSAPGTRSATNVAVTTSIPIVFPTPSTPNLNTTENEGVTKNDDDNDSLSASGEGETSINQSGGNSLFSGNIQINSLTPELEARRQLLIENLIGMVCLFFNYCI